MLEGTLTALSSTYERPCPCNPLSTNGRKKSIRREGSWLHHLRESFRAPRIKLNLNYAILMHFYCLQEESLGGRSLTAGGEGGLPADNHAVLFCSRQTSAAQPEASEPLHEYIASRTESGSVYNLASQLFEYPFYGHSHCSPPLHIAVLSGCGDTPHIHINIKYGHTS